jgi:hypothetical protein
MDGHAVVVLLVEHGTELVLHGFEALGSDDGVYELHRVIRSVFRSVPDGGVVGALAVGGDIESIALLFVTGAQRRDRADEGRNRQRSDRGESSSDRYSEALEPELAR